MPRGTRAIPPACLARCRSADAILHAGDLSGLAVLELLRSLGPPVHAVRGNVEDPDVAAALPERLVVGAAGVRIGMIHDAGPRTDRLRRLRGAFPDADAVVFGHSHMPEHAEAAGFQIFNPGSATERRRAPRCTMGLARVSDRRIAFELLSLP